MSIGAFLGLLRRHLLGSPHAEWFCQYPFTHFNKEIFNISVEPAPISTERSRVDIGAGSAGHAAEFKAA